MGLLKKKRNRKNINENMNSRGWNKESNEWKIYKEKKNNRGVIMKRNR